MEPAPGISRASGTSLLHAVQRLLEVGQQVPPVLDPHRNAHQAVADARLIQLLGGHTGVRGGFRMAHQRLHSAERDGITPDPQAAQKIDARETSKASQISNRRAALTRFLPLSYF